MIARHLTKGNLPTGGASQLHLVSEGSVEVCSRAILRSYGHWMNAFGNQRKDHRFYELVEDTIQQGFQYWYFVIKNGRGEVQAIQPFFILDQDLLAGVTPK